MLTFSRLGRAASATAVAVALGLGAITIAASAHGSASGARLVAGSQAASSGASATDQGVCGCALN
jgi:hypothetical protein